MSGRLNLYPHGTTGKLIVFCGLDGCGKSTAIRQMQERLLELGEPVFVTKQPTPALRETGIFRTFTDQQNHSQYDYRALSLMAAADRLQHVRAEILPRLREGQTVLCDRYFYSCLANLRARGYGADRWIYEIAEKLPRPDYAFWISRWRLQWRVSAADRRNGTDTSIWSCNSACGRNTGGSASTAAVF